MVKQEVNLWQCLKICLWQLWHCENCENIVTIVCDNVTEKQRACLRQCSNIRHILDGEGDSSGVYTSAMNLFIPRWLESIKLHLSFLLTKVFYEESKLLKWEVAAPACTRGVDMCVWGGGVWVCVHVHACMHVRIQDNGQSLIGLRFYSQPEPHWPPCSFLLHSQMQYSTVFNAVQRTVSEEYSTVSSDYVTTVQ